MATKRLPSPARRKGTLAYACSRLPGGNFTFMEFARLSEDPQVLSVLGRWDSLSHYGRRRVSLEGLCKEAGLTPGRLLGRVVEAAFEFNAYVAGLVEAVMHPEVVQASIEGALEPHGFLPPSAPWPTWAGGHSAGASLNAPPGPFLQGAVELPWMARRGDFERQIIEASRVAREASLKGISTCVPPRNTR